MNSVPNGFVWLRNTFIAASSLMVASFLLLVVWALAPLLLYWPVALGLGLVLVGLFAVPIMLQLFVPKPTLTAAKPATAATLVWTPSMWGGVAGWLALFAVGAWFGPSRLQSAKLELMIAFALYSICLLVVGARWVLRYWRAVACAT